MPRFVTSLLLLAWPGMAWGAAQAPERLPLSRLAADFAAQLGHGAVAMAEKRDGRWEFSLAGEPFAAGHARVPPERVLFEIGSISKVFTGILLADATLEGKLALDDPLTRRLPVRFEHPETGAITLRQLATHTSCLPRLPDNLALADTVDPFASYDRAALFRYLAAARLPGPPPCASAYSSLAFGVLGVVLEIVYGKPWAALVREKIAGPLGMEDTVQALSADQRARFALPWSGSEPAHEWTAQALAGAGALRSTAADMSRFADAMIAGARGPLGKAWPLLAGDYVEVPAIGARIGLAVEHVPADAGDARGDFYTHEGDTGGFHSLLLVWPSSARAIVILASNGAAFPLDWVARWDQTGEPPERREIALPTSALDAYAGVYTIDQQMRLTILSHGESLLARLTGQPFWPIFASAPDEFFFRALPARLSFHRDAAGKVDRLSLHQYGRSVPAIRGVAPLPHLDFPSATALAAYAGEYDFGAFKAGARMTVSVRGETLFAMLTGQPAFPVFAVGKDRFEYEVIAAALTFERDAAGKVAAVVLHQDGKDKKAPRLPQLGG